MSGMTTSPAMRTALSGDERSRVVAAAAMTPGPPENIVNAARLIQTRVASIAEKILEQIRTEVPHYGSRISAPADLGAMVGIALQASVSSLSDPDELLASAEYAWRLGRIRARQGVPLLALRQCYQIGAAVLWQELLEAATEADPAQSLAVARSAGEFWRFCERDTRLMVDSYRLASTGAESDSERKLLPLLRAFLRGHADPVDVASASVALDLPSTGRYAVVRIPGGSSAAEQPVRGDLDGMTVYRCPQRYGLSVVVHLGDRTPEDVRAALAERFPALTAGISSAVDGLINLGHANQLAELALRVGGDAASSPILLSDRLPAALLVARPDLGGVLATTVLGPVLTLDDADRDVLLDTLRAWLDADGSAARAGKELFCHHNTVLNRLRRLEKLTGRQLDRPRDLVALTLALEAFDIRERPA